MAPCATIGTPRPWRRWRRAHRLLCAVRGRGRPARCLGSHVAAASARVSGLPGRIGGRWQLLALFWRLVRGAGGGRCHRPAFGGVRVVVDAATAKGAVEASPPGSPDGIGIGQRRGRAALRRLGSSSSASSPPPRNPRRAHAVAVMRARGVHRRGRDGGSPSPRPANGGGRFRPRRWCSDSMWRRVEQPATSPYCRAGCARQRASSASHCRCAAKGRGERFGHARPAASSIKLPPAGCRNPTGKRRAAASGVHGPGDPRCAGVGDPRSSIASWSQRHTTRRRFTEQTSRMRKGIVRPAGGCIRSSPRPVRVVAVGSRLPRPPTTAH